MKTRQRRPNASLLGRTAVTLALGALAACITVNVNFPESAVQRAADDFVRDLYKETAEVKKPSEKKSGKLPAAPPSKPSSWIPSLFPEAFAQEINTGTPKALEIKSRMKSRVAGISKLKEKGALCETQDGMLMAKQAGEATKLAKAENADREELYEEIQTANKITDRKQTRIRKFFAAAFRENSPAGTCVEAEDGSWTKK